MIKRFTRCASSNADPFKSQFYYSFFSHEQQLSNSSEMQIEMRLTDFFISPRNVSWIYFYKIFSAVFLFT